MQGTCIVDECGREGTVRRGLCGKHYERLRRTGTTASSRPKLGPLCAVEGCEKPRGTRTHCPMHARRLRLHGSVGGIAPTRMSSSQPASVRISINARRTESGCLEWTAYCDPDGYGRVTLMGRPQHVHRAAWIEANGAIPDGLHVLHHCDNPPCCQMEPTEGYPEGHLFLGTPADNMADKVSKGRWRVA